MKMIVGKNTQIGGLEMEYSDTLKELLEMLDDLTLADLIVIEKMLMEKLYGKEGGIDESL
jgi:hypothetical protein